MTAITPIQENARMLASIVGIDESEAVELLNRTVVISYSPDGEPLAQELRAQLERTVRVAENGPCDLEVIIGVAPVTAAAKRLYVTTTADAAVISASPEIAGAPPVPLHGLQTMIAACYAAGAVLRQVIQGLPGADSDPFVVRFEALGATRPILEHPITLDDAVLIGAGAVGNGFLRAARYLNINGVLTIADPKKVGSGNPNRCLYFYITDVGQSKAFCLAEKAQADFAGLKLEPMEMTFTDLVKHRSRIRRAIVATDSRRVRRSIQKDLPVEVLDASTTDASEVIVHSHRQPTDGACLACIYRHVPDELARARDIASGLGLDIHDVTDNDLIDARIAEQIVKAHPGLDANALISTAFDSLFKQLCGEMALLSPTGAQVLAPFAFVSNLAGALLALELSRFESDPNASTHNNYLNLSPWYSPHSKVRSRRGRIPECEFCGSPGALSAMRQVWPEVFS
jgi:hypothetical protein